MKRFLALLLSLVLTLTLTIDSQDATGTYADGVITVDLFGATCTFEPSAE